MALTLAATYPCSEVGVVVSHASHIPHLAQLLSLMSMTAGLLPLSTLSLRFPCLITALAARRLGVSDRVNCVSCCLFPQSHMRVFGSRAQLYASHAIGHCLSLCNLLVWIPQAVACVAIPGSCSCTRISACDLRAVFAVAFPGSLMNVRGPSNISQFQAL